MPQDHQTTEASEATEADNGRKGTNPKPDGSGSSGAVTAGLRGPDTRQTYKLNGLDGKKIKIPKTEECLFLIYCELRLIRLYMKNQGGK